MAVRQALGLSALIIGLNLSMPHYAQSQLLDPDHSEDCELTPNTGTTCLSPMQEFKATIVRLYLCDGMPDYTSFSNCADTGLVDENIAIAPGTATTFSSNRIPAGTYSHFGIVYDNAYEYSMSIKTNMPVTPQAGITANPGTGNYCWTVSGPRPEGYPRPQFQCGEALPESIEAGQSAQTIQREGIFPQACFWTMGPPNSPIYDNFADQCFGGSPAVKSYELCTRYFLANYANYPESFLPCAKSALGDDMLNQSEVNALFESPEHGYTKRTYVDALVDGTVDSQGNLSLSLTENQAEVKYKFVGRLLQSPLVVTDLTRGLDLQVTLTGGAFLTIVCGDTACTGKNTEALTLTINPQPL